MNSQDYEQKKRECWEEIAAEVAVETGNLLCKAIAYTIFDRAYALGKLEKDAKKPKKMCLRDRRKFCDLCHECDIDISNPYHNNAILP